METIACTNCGSTNLIEPPQWENLIGSSALGGQKICGRCGYRTIPVIFQSENKRKRYERKKAGYVKRPKAHSAYQPLITLTRRPWLLAALYIILALFVPLIILFLVGFGIMAFIIKQKRDGKQNLSLIVLGILLAFTIIFLVMAVSFVI